MANIQVREGQNIIDIALQEFGKAEAVFELAKDNNISISEVLNAGQELIINETNILDLNILQYFKSQNTKIVTGNEILPQYTGDFDSDFNFDFGEDFNS